MRKGRLQQRQIVIAVDRDSGTLDLSVFALSLKGQPNANCRHCDAQDGRRTRSATAANRKTSSSRNYSLRQRLPQKSRRNEGRQEPKTHCDADLAANAAYHLVSRVTLRCLGRPVLF